MMTMKYFRRITISRDEYGTISLPKRIFDKWVANGYAHVELVYDENEDTLVVVPV